MKEIVSNLRFLSRVMRPYIRTCLYIVCIGLINVALSLQIIVQSKQAFDIASKAIEGDLMWCLFLLALLLFASICIEAWSYRLNVSYQLRIRNELSSEIFDRILRAEWLSAQRYHSGDVMSRVNTDLGDWVQFAATTVPQFIITFFKLGSAFVFLFILDKMLALLLALLIPLVLLLSKSYFRKIRKLSFEIKDTYSSVIQFFQESVQHQGLVKALHLRGWFEKELDNRQGDYAERIYRHTRLSVFSKFVLSIGFTAIYCISLAWGLFRLEAGEISFGTMTAFLQLVGMIQGPAAGIMGFIPAFIAAYTATERLHELWVLPMEDKEEAVKVKNIERITLQQVSFGYVPGKPVLVNQNMEFRKGMTALVGETGCGKTTSIRLILGLIKPERGRVLLSDGLKDYVMKPALRCNFAYVPQGGFLFSGTIRENLLMGNPHATDEDMIKVLKSVSADFVWKSREGLDTFLKENGQGLSGGQVQRLAIARALLSGGQILLLDEATSALDEKTESEIILSLRENIHDRIIILVSHRRSVVEKCDFVYKMMQKEIKNVSFSEK